MPENVTILRIVTADVINEDEVILEQGGRGSSSTKAGVTIKIEETQRGEHHGEMMHRQ